MKTTKQKGFTIVELMIATVVFSMILLLCLTGMVQVSRAYYKGITHSKTQEAARNLIDEITETIQLSGSAISFVNPTSAGPNIAAGSVADGLGAFCAGNRKYTYALDRKVTGTSTESSKEIKNALVSQDESCTDTITADIDVLNNDVDLPAGDRSILADNMRLTHFSISRVTPNAAVDIKEGAQLWRVEISLAYGDQDLISYTDDEGNDRVTCQPGTGNEFCSIVEIVTIVGRRIG